MSLSAIGPISGRGSDCVEGCVHIYMDTERGSDDNPGTEERPVKSMTAAYALMPETYKQHCRIHTNLDEGDLIDPSTWIDPAKRQP